MLTTCIHVHMSVYAYAYVNMGALTTFEVSMWMGKIRKHYIKQFPMLFSSQQSLKRTVSDFFCGCFAYQFV